jgi:predicted RNase H-like nuclease (RuvC/YqgF family)
MLKENTDLNVLRRMIDLIESEYQANTNRDRKIHRVEQDLLEYHMTLQRLQERLQELQAKLTSIEAENIELRMVNSQQADTIAELQCWVDPYSQDGTPICNSYLS